MQPIELHARDLLRLLVSAARSAAEAFNPSTTQQDPDIYIGVAWEAFTAQARLLLPADAPTSVLAPLSWSLLEVIEWMCYAHARAVLPLSWAPAVCQGPCASSPFHIATARLRVLTLELADVGVTVVPDPAPAGVAVINPPTHLRRSATLTPEPEYSANASP